MRAKMMGGPCLMLIGFRVWILMLGGMTLLLVPSCSRTVLPAGNPVTRTVWERVAAKPRVVADPGVVRVRVDMPCWYPLLFVDEHYLLVSPQAPPYGSALVVWDRVSGKQGCVLGREGPGAWGCWPTVGRDERGLWVTSTGKIAWFGDEGRLLGEQDLPADIEELLPLPRAWVGCRNALPSEASLRQDPFHQERVWVTLDKDFSGRSEVLRIRGRILESHDFVNGQKLICEPTCNTRSLLWIWEGLAYVGDPDGGRIFMLDERGVLQKTLFLPWKRRSVLPAEARELEEQYEDWRRQNPMGLHVHKTWPFFHSFRVTDGAIWCLLFPHGEGRELVRLNLEGGAMAVYRLRDCLALENGSWGIRDGLLYLLEEEDGEWIIREVRLP